MILRDLSIHKEHVTGFFMLNEGQVIEQKLMKIVKLWATPFTRNVVWEALAPRCTREKRTEMKKELIRKPAWNSKVSSVNFCPLSLKEKIRLFIS